MMTYPMSETRRDILRSARTLESQIIMLMSPRMLMESGEGGRVLENLEFARENETPCVERKEKGSRQGFMHSVHAYIIAINCFTNLLK